MSRECAQAPETPRCSFWAKELVAPGNGRIHCLLALGDVAGSGSCGQDVVLQAAEQILAWDHFHPRRRVEGQWQGIEPSTNRRDGGAVRGRETKARSDVPNSLHQQPHRWRACEIRGRHRVRVHIECERSDRILALPPQTERGAARDQHFERGTDVRRSAISGAASRTCSKLSTTNNVT